MKQPTSANTGFELVNKWQLVHLIGGERLWELLKRPRQKTCHCIKPESAISPQQSDLHQRAIN